MKIRYLILISLLVASFCQAETASDYDVGTTGVELPKSAKELLLAKLDAKKISGVDQLVFRRLQDFDHLGVEAWFEVSWSWEKAFLHDFILRKKVSDPDWSKAEFFDAKLPVTVVLGRLPIDESALSP
jgi:hypothetical protein